MRLSAALIIRTNTSPNGHRHRRFVLRQPRMCHQRRRNHELVTRGLTRHDDSARHGVGQEITPENGRHRQGAS